MHVVSWLLVGVCLITSQASAQSTPPPVEVDWDLLSEQLPPDEGEAEEVLLRWQHWLETPLVLDARAAGMVDLLPYLAPSQAHALSNRLRRGPALTSADELANLPGFDDAVVALIAPFVGFPVATPSQTPLEIELLHRLGQTLTGNDPAAASYAGSPLAAYTRLRVVYGRWMVRLAAEKDAGEALRWSPERSQFGMDHVAGSVAFRHRDGATALVLGDFQAHTGYGLLLGAAYRTIAGATPTRDVVDRASGLSAYGSAGETTFLRGAAVALRPLPALEVITFASRRPLTARIDTLDTPTMQPVLTSISSTGLHRTELELNRRGAAHRDDAGLHIGLRLGRWRAGVQAIAAAFSLPVAPGNTIADTYAFRGRTYRAESGYARFQTTTWTFFGELGRTGAGAWGGIAGIQAEASPSIDALLLVRHYNRAFNPLAGNAFRASGARPQNERGVYAALHLHPSRAWQLAAYADASVSPWLRSTLPLPSQRRDGAIRITYRPANYLEAQFVAGAEVTPERVVTTDAAGRSLEGLDYRRRSTARIHLAYSHSEKLRFRMRLDTAVRSGAVGTLLYVDTHWRPSDRLRVAARVATFASDEAGVTRYAYEDDVYSRFTVAQYAGIGDRFYIVVTRRWRQHLVTDVKYEVQYVQASPLSVASSGSSFNAGGNETRRTLRIQLYWRWRR